MKVSTKNILFEAWQHCNNQDKSSEFMLQYMQDFAGVNLDCVLSFLRKTTIKERIAYLKKPSNNLSN